VYPQNHTPHGILPLTASGRLESLNHGPINAHFDGHAITPDECVDIPINVPLRVTIESATATPPADAPAASDKPIPTLAERMKGFIGCLEGLPADAAINHDHYLYGTPKKP
jgi:hypothetical protein